MRFATSASSSRQCSRIRRRDSEKAPCRFLCPKTEGGTAFPNPGMPQTGCFSATRSPSGFNLR